MHVRFQNFEDVESYVNLLHQKGAEITIFTTDVERDKIVFTSVYAILIRRETATSWVAITGDAKLFQRYKKGYRCLKHHKGDITWGAFTEADFACA